MSRDELSNLLALSCEERFDYCVAQIVEEKEIWILINQDKQFLKIYSEDEAFEYLPIWSSRELAKQYSEDTANLEPKSISLPEFMKRWVPGLMKDNVEIGVFPGSDSTIWITDAEDFQKDLQDELLNF